MRKARPADAVQIKAVIDEAAQRGGVLPRSLSELYDQVRDFWVVEAEDGGLLGCAALHVVWEDLAEVKSVVVREEARGRGLGTRLVERCIEEARSLGLPRLFVLTAIPAYFARFGFVQVDKATLPHKIWAECIRCSKFPNCNEVAMVLDLRGPSA